MIKGKDWGIAAVRGRLVTVKEMSVFLRVSERWIEDRMKEGTFPIPWYPINPKTRVSDSADINEWFMKIRVSAGSAPLPKRAIKQIQNEEVTA